jgi:hypothetical protein
VRPRAPISCALLVALATACGREIDQASFSKIQTEMPESEVIALLGEPTDSEAFSLGGLSATSATWVGPEGTIAIQFVNGKVLLKSFTSEPEAGQP